MPTCAKGHQLDLHLGKGDGELTCDGPLEACCGGRGILEPGVERYSCVECDFDLCVPCQNALDAGVKQGRLSEDTKAANYEQAYNHQQLHEAMLGETGGLTGKALNATQGRKTYTPKNKKSTKSAEKSVDMTAEEREAAETAAEKAAAALLAEEEAATPNARKAKASKTKVKNSPPTAATEAPPPPAAAIDPERRERADAALKGAVATGDLETIRRALASEAASASEDAMAEARKARDRLREKAKKAAKKAAKSEPPSSPQSVVIDDDWSDAVIV
jgi:hypothetical protein